eukprot:9744168-Karenia_brevis.AAC.1
MAVCGDIAVKRLERSRWIHVISFSAAISACDKDGLWQREVAMPSEMSETPDWIQFTITISCCFDANPR